MHTTEDDLYFFHLLLIILVQMDQLEQEEMEERLDFHHLHLRFLEDHHYQV